MPLNTLRLNHQVSSHPNDRIVFIKPFPRPPAERSDYDTAELILKVIAAQCLPIMKDHYLSVTTLEEHEPNPEFIGRNFNNGEIIQLVIRSKSGGWLPLNMIQMVMMHELAHNLHMNHGKGFWQTRNIYAGEMRQLWAKGYTGEGLWGRGRTLTALGSALGDNVVRSEELADLPVCGGTFRSRRRKRKARNDLTWKEKRDRRIEKKFGKNGVALGEDEDKRLSLEVNRSGPLGVKPRVAQSKRGRELRAAAALARFDTNKKEVEALEEIKKEDEENETEEDEYDEADINQPDAVDADGSKLLDSQGHSMIKVCEDRDNDDVNVKQEMEELGNLENAFPMQEGDSETATASEEEVPYSSKRRQSKSRDAKSTTVQGVPPASATSKTMSKSTSGKTSPSKISNLQATANDSTISCPICTSTNDTFNPTCLICAHVLDARKDPQHWRCTSEACRGSEYINASDCGVCGVCGAHKPTGDS